MKTILMQSLRPVPLIIFLFFAVTVFALPATTEPAIKILCIMFFVAMFVLIILFFIQAFKKNRYLGFWYIKSIVME